MVHILREAKEYLPELSRVAELDGKIVGAIFYSKAKVVDGNTEHEILTFGLLCVEPTCFSMGIGAKLLEETIKLAGMPVSRELLYAESPTIIQNTASIPAINLVLCTLN